MVAVGFCLMAARCLLLATAQGSRLKTKGSRFKAQGSRLKAQGSRLRARGWKPSLINSAAFVQKTQLICACARTLAKQPVLRINTMIRNINRRKYMFNSRLVFVACASAILEGERDYSEQTLASPTFQRMYCLRGVVNMYPMNVKV